MSAPAARDHGARDRRQVPGSRHFVLDNGPAMVICATRSGVSRYRERAARLPAHYLLAPLDADPGSMCWPVAGAPGVTLVTAGAPDEFVLRLTQVLLSDGAELVMQLRDERPYVSFHLRNPEPTPT